MIVFLFTDIEGSSNLWEEHTGVMTGILARHDEILREQIEGHGGRITNHTGTGLAAAFGLSPESLQPERSQTDPIFEIGQV